MIDPPMTREDIAEWQAVSPAGQINTVFLAVIEASGMSAAMPKEVVKRFPS
jgi:hypothetical protein